MGKPGILKEAPRAILMLVVDKDTARQNADRAFKHAHILIENEMGDFRRIEQCLDGRNQYGIIGSDKLPQRAISRPASQPLLPLLSRRSLLQVGDQFHLAPPARHRIQYETGDD